MRLGIIIILIIALLSSYFVISSDAPTEVVCSTSEIKIGNTCCEDLNDNEMCDKDERIYQPKMKKIVVTGEVDNKDGNEMTRYEINEDNLGVKTTTYEISDKDDYDSFAHWQEYQQNKEARDEIETQKKILEKYKDDDDTDKYKTLTQEDIDKKFGKKEETTEESENNYDEIPEQTDMEQFIEELFNRNNQEEEIVEETVEEVEEEIIVTAEDDAFAETTV